MSTYSSGKSKEKGKNSNLDGAKAGVIQVCSLSVPARHSSTKLHLSFSRTLLMGAWAACIVILVSKKSIPHEHFQKSRLQGVGMAGASSF
jgi:hypothetical protein